MDNATIAGGARRGSAAAATPSRSAAIGEAPKDSRLPSRLPGAAEGWIVGEEAASMLGCSLRAVQRRAQVGAIRTEKRAAYGRKAALVYSLADVEKLRAEMESAERGPTAIATAGMPEHNSLTQMIATMAEALRGFPRPGDTGDTPRVAQRWLTLPEAERVSGLSQRLLQRLAEKREIVAQKDQGEWKLERGSLDQWRPTPRSRRRKSVEG